MMVPYFMATALAVAAIVSAAVAVAASIAATVFSIISSRKAQSGVDTLDPQSAEELRITQAREGSVVPLTFGENKMNGNIIWNDHPLTQEIREQVGGGGGKFGGGGGGSSEQVTGFRYFISLWISVCQVHTGRVEWVKQYVNETEKEPFFVEAVSNDGTEDTKPEAYENLAPPPFASRLPGIAWWFYQWFVIGENTTVLPTVHYVTRIHLNTGINHENMYDFDELTGDLSPGNNPAAICYELFLMAGADSSELDLDSFNASADFWKTKGYGLSIVFLQQENLDKLIGRIIALVDGAIGVNNEGKFTLKAFDPDEEPVVSLNSITDTIKLSFTKESFADLPNNFKCSYIDRNQDYTKRMGAVMNDSAIFHADGKNTKSLDYSGLSTEKAASKRLFEEMKINSFPAIQMRLETDLRQITRRAGDIFEISDDDVQNARFRITKVTPNFDKNQMKFEGIELIEKRIDSNFLLVGSEPSNPLDTTIAALSHIKVFELPYSTEFGFEPAFLILVQRAKLIETGFQVFVSDDIGGEFVSYNVFSSFSQKGSLDSAYNVSNQFDRSLTGLEYTPIAAFDPTFGSISESQLYSIMRGVIVGDEIIAFQNVQGLGGDPASYRLTNLIRGVLHTPIENHVIGKEVWVSQIGDNVLTGVPFNNFYIKVVPVFPGQSIDPSLVPAIAVNTTFKAKQPRKLGAIRATRSGSSITIKCFPTTPGIQGYGSLDYALGATQSPYSFQDQIVLSWDSNEQILTPGSDSFSFSRAGAFTLNSKTRLNGFESGNLALSIDTIDQDYWAAT